MQWLYCICVLSEKPITSVYTWFTSCNLNNWSVNLRIYSVIALTTTAHSIKYTCFPFVIKELITFFWYLFLWEVNTKLFYNQMETLLFQWNYKLNVWLLYFSWITFSNLYFRYSSNVLYLIWSFVWYQIS